MKNLFEIKKVWKTYHAKGVETHALKNIDLIIEKGEYVAITGPSGSGKSTLMHIVGCLDTPSKGQVFLEGENISEFDSDELARVRREKLGFIFQSYNLITGLSAVENVALPMRFNKVSKEDAEKKAVKLLNDVDLGHRLTHRPNELSGGEQQRVSVARALANDPEAILADEPTGNLDSKSGAEIFGLLENLHKKQKKTVIIVTHDVHLADRIEKKIHIKDGEIVKSGVT